MPKFRRLSLGNRLRRLASHRFIIPLKRNPHPPEYSAVGILVGIFWGLTPTVGIQLAMVLATWVIGGRIFRWKFSLLVACAWTAISNPLTAIPMYYVFYVTGQLMLGRWDDVAGYQGFVALFSATFAWEAGVLELAGATLTVIVADWGLAMLIGSLPYAALGATLGYALGLRFIIRYRAAKAARAARKRQSRPGRGSASLGSVSSN